MKDLMSLLQRTDRAVASESGSRAGMSRRSRIAKREFTESDKMVLRDLLLKDSTVAKQLHTGTRQVARWRSENFGECYTTVKLPS